MMSPLTAAPRTDRESLERKRRRLRMLRYCPQCLGIILSSTCSLQNCRNRTSKSKTNLGRWMYIQAPSVYAPLMEQHKAYHFERPARRIIHRVKMAVSDSKDLHDHSATTADTGSIMISS